MYVSSMLSSVTGNERRKSGGNTPSFSNPLKASPKLILWQKLPDALLKLSLKGSLRGHIHLCSHPCTKSLRLDLERASLLIGSELTAFSGPERRRAEEGEKGESL